MNEAPPGARPLQLGPGLIAAALVLAVYGGLGLSVDFPAAAGGFKSDEATYYMMAWSLAEHLDLRYGDCRWSARCDHLGFCHQSWRCRQPVGTPRATRT